MEQYVIDRLKEALHRCKETVKEVKGESDDVSFAIGYEHGAMLVLSEVENVLETYCVRSK